MESAAELRLVIAVARDYRSSAAVDGYVTLEKPPPDAQHVVVSALCPDFAPLAARSSAASGGRERELLPSRVDRRRYWL
jgi:hypothetical protein